MQVNKLKTVDAETLLSTPMKKTMFIVDGLIPLGVYKRLSERPPENKACDY